MDVTLEMSTLAFLEQGEVDELVRPSQQFRLDRLGPRGVLSAALLPDGQTQGEHRNGG